MRLRWLSLVLVLPLFGYLGYRLISAFRGWDAITVVTFAVLVVFNVSQMVPWRGRWVSLSGIWSVVVLILLVGLSLGLAGGVGLDIAAAMLLASPFLLESWIWQGDSNPGRALLALQFAFLDGVMIVAALDTLSASGVPATSGPLIYSFGAVNVEQLRGLYNLLVGLPVGALPLQSAMDAAFVVLGGVALLGVFVPLLEPQTGSGYALPIGDADRGPVTVAYSPELEMARGETLALLRRRSAPRPPPYSKLPGIWALVASGTVTLLFVVVSLEWPTQSLLPSFLVLGGFLVAILLMTRLSIRVPRIAPVPPRPEPAPGEPAPPVVRPLRLV